MSPVTSYVVETLVTLVGVVVLAVLVLYGGRRFGAGRPSGPLELVGRLPLDARRAVYLVRVGNLVYVVGASEAGLTRLGEIEADAVPNAPSAPVPPRFADFLAKLGGRASTPPRDETTTTAAPQPKGGSDA
jgi:flagellar biogenesis protein FliO